MNTELFVSQIGLRCAVPEEDYVGRLPVVKNLYNMGKLEFHRPVTFFVGENGIGKSTLIEAIAVALGFNPEGGRTSFDFATRDSHSSLYEYLRVGRTAKRRKDGFFLRAESFYNVASYIDSVDAAQFYGGRSLHERSHGESFLALMESRFEGNGLYIFDEPEAALSPKRILRLMVIINELVKKGSQFIISTHSPMLMSFTGAEIYQLNEDSIESVDYTETEHFVLMKRFLENPERMLGYLLD